MVKTKPKSTTETNAGITGAELKARRVALSATQSQMAERLGVDPNTYARWERQSMRIGCPVILKLAIDHIMGVGRPLAFPAHRPSAVRGE